MVEFCIGVDGQKGSLVTVNSGSCRVGQSPAAEGHTSWAKLAEAVHQVDRRDRVPLVGPKLELRRLCFFVWYSWDLVSCQTRGGTLNCWGEDSTML